MLFEREHLLRFFAPRFIFGAGLLALFLFGYWHWLAYQQFLVQPLAMSENQQILVVKPGDSVNRLARRWQQQKLINNRYYLKLLCNLNPELKKIKAGEYRLEAVETPLSLMTKLSQGIVIQYSLTIVEGMNSFQIIQLIGNTEFLNNDLPDTPLKLAEKLKLPQNHVEGWLFPDTYYFSRDTSALGLLRRSRSKMQQVLSHEWSGRAQDLPYQSPYQALIMASIIEKETGISSERERIAGVFVRRLRNRMRLQTDPTVIYGIGPDFNGDITYKDLRAKTPYNTYVIKGLPPTPIAMPGQAAIYAALHPEAGDSLYFVADGTGGHHFSATLEEHNLAVRRYLKKSKN